MLTPAIHSSPSQLPANRQTLFRFFRLTILSLLGTAFLTGMLAPVWAQSGRSRSNVPPPTKASQTDNPNGQSDGLKSMPNLPSQDEEPLSSTASGKELGQDDTLKIEATLVSLPVVVSDSNGHYLPFLKKNQFRLTEDGVKQEISFFAPERVPFHVAVVLDVSGSTTLSIQDMQEAADTFVDQLREDDKVAIFVFSGDTRMLCDFTNDRRELHDAIAQVRSGGSTKLFEAVYKVVTEHLEGIEGRKAMILLTDGEDTSSRKVRAEEAVRAVEEADVLTYVIRYPPSDTTVIMPGGGGGNRFPFPMPRIPFPWPRSPQPRRNPPGRPWPFQPQFFGDPQGQQSGQYPQQPRQMPGPRYSQETFLYDLTRATGGELYDYDTIGSLSDLFARVAEELRHVYVVGYYPTNPLENGGFRRIRVSVTEPGAKVRAREGYTARAPQPVDATQQP